MSDDRSGNMPDAFDRLLGQFEGGLPGLTKTKISTLRFVPTLGVGGSQQVTVQTFRQDGRLEDEADPDVKRMPAKFTTFVQLTAGDKVVRLILNDDILTLLRRQVDSLTAVAQRRAAQRAAATRKARGITPAFLKHGKRKK
jgi:hypothetical protein